MPSHPDRRTIVLEEAAGCLARYGYAKDNISRAARLNKASLYHCFPNKDELFMTVVLRENAYYGKLFWGSRMYEADGQTSRLAKNGKPLKDLVILRDFTYDDGEWEDDTIYDPGEGKTYSCRLQLAGNQLNIQGYIGVSLLGRETIWQRI